MIGRYKGFRCAWMVAGVKSDIRIGLSEQLGDMLEAMQRDEIIKQIN